MMYIFLTKFRLVPLPQVPSKPPASLNYVRLETGYSFSFFFAASSPLFQKPSLFGPLALFTDSRMCLFPLPLAGPPTSLSGLLRDARGLLRPSRPPPRPFPSISPPCRCQNHEVSCPVRAPATLPLPPYALTSPTPPRSFQAPGALSRAP